MACSCVALAEEFHQAVVTIEPRTVVVFEQASGILFASLDHRRRRRPRASMSTLWDLLSALETVAAAPLFSAE